MALNGDIAAADLLFKIRDTFQLDGEYGEMNSEALEIFNVYMKLMRKQN